MGRQEDENHQSSRIELPSEGTRPQGMGVWRRSLELIQKTQKNKVEDATRPASGLSDYCFPKKKASSVLL
jgi:hypothetical protein